MHVKILIFVVAGLIVSACAPIETQSPQIDSELDVNVGFENPAYVTGGFYDKAAQSQDWTLTNNPTRMDKGQAIITDKEAASGSRALQINYSANVQEVKQAYWDMPRAQSYTLEYKVKFADGFDFNGSDPVKGNGGKLPGLAGRGFKRGICAGGDDCLKVGGFSARLMWRTDGGAVLYLYDLTKSAAGRKYGEDIAFAKDAAFIPGRWHHIRQTVTLNDPGRSNGSIEIDMDGQPAVRLLDREIIGPDAAIDMVLFSTFFGGNSPEWFPATPQTAYFDDFKVYQE